MEKLVLIDGNSILNRAFFALPPLNSKEGQNVNAVYGFLNILLKVLADVQPTHLAVAFDKRGHNFRKDLYPEYKSNRHGMPDDLAAQMPVLKDVLSAMRIRIVEEAGIEADDIIGTLTNRFQKNTFIVSGDRDLLQLVNASTTVLLTKKGVTEVEEVTQAYLRDAYRLTPAQIVDYKALRGDASDCIPGVKGIGEKTALSLLELYQSLDGVYEHLGETKPAVQSKLAEGKDMAYLSKILATIVTDVKIPCTYEECLLHPFGQNVKTILEDLDFRSLLKRMRFEETVSETAEKEVKIVTIRTEEEARRLCRKLLEEKRVAVYWGECLCFAADDETEYEVCVSDNFLEELTLPVVLEVFQSFFEGRTPKVVYDGKDLRHKLHRFGITLSEVHDDVSIMQYLVEYRAFQDVTSLLNHYGCTRYASGLFFVASVLSRKLEEYGMHNLYREIELPLSLVLFEMEEEGFKVDVDVLQELLQRYREEQRVCQSEIWQLAGEEFNVLSPKQLGTVLFEKLNLPHAKKTKTGYSTNVEVLEKIADEHPIVPLVLKMRQLSKLIGTYLEGFLPLVDQNGCIHTTFQQTLTSTGRLSSTEPNLQNLPVRDDIGKEIRKMFVPKYDLLISADYSQIKLRLLAQFSGDENLMNTFAKDEDIHAAVAAEIFGVPLQMVTANMRRMAKAVNFGVIYGISDFGLSKNIHVPVSKAKEFIEKYFAGYPKIKAYLHEGVEQAKSTGYVTTITGRRRQIPEIQSSNFQLRSFGERAAMNMPLQGSAADLIKIAMVRIADELKRRGLRSRLVLQVHDELIIDTVLQEREEVKSILKREMEHAIETKVKLSVNISEGKNLYEAK